MRNVLLLVVLGCGANPVEQCEVEGADCCRIDEECFEAYGDVFPYCVEPGAKSGICAQCLTGDDCGVYDICVDDPVLGKVCTPRDL